MQDDAEMIAVWNDAAGDLERTLAGQALPGVVFAASPAGLQHEDVMEKVFASRNLYAIRLKKGRDRIYVASREPALSTEDLEAVLRAEGIEGKNVRLIV